MSKVCFEAAPLTAVDDFSLGVGEDSRENLRKCIDINIHYNFPVTRDNYIQEFYDLVATWRDEVKFTSSVLEMSMNLSYQKIIGMGDKVIPLILQELSQRPDHWFWALAAITRANPILPEQRGNISEMVTAWVNWAKENDYEWE